MTEAASDDSENAAEVERGSERVANSSCGSNRASEVIARLGDYELLEEIGHGGMGVVYRARQVSLDRVVAIKMMTFGPDSSPELVKRFRVEAVSAASLHHPNIVAIHEVGVVEDRHFFVMDYVEGQSLAQLLGNQPLPARRAATYLKTIAEAVHYAHERGVLHRDLKPSNVLIDQQDQPRVVDFGLAKRLGDSQISTLNPELTVSGQVLGSPHYLPPEQATGQRTRISRRTDVYALGATLYHLLTGHPPFQSESLAQTLDLLLRAEPVAPRLLNPGVPVDLETICLKCMEKEPVRRFATAQELADELARFLAGEPIRARPLGLVGKAWRWCRRKPSLAGAVGVALLSFLVGVAGVILQWRRAEASELSLQHRTYIAEISSAQLALRDNDPRRALELLNRHRQLEKSKIQHSGSDSSYVSRSLPLATDLRGFEWRYLWQQCQNEAEAAIGKLRGPIRSLEVSPDGQWLFAGSIGGEPSLWNLSTGEPMHVAGEAGWAYAAFSPDSRLLLTDPQTPAAYGAIDVWDLQSRKRVETIRDPRRIATMAFSSDGRWFGFGVHQPPQGRRVVILDFHARKQVGELITRSLMAGWDFGADWFFTHDGQGLIFSENDSKAEIGLYNLAAGDSRYFAGHREPITAMAISPDGQWLATGAGKTETAIRLRETESFGLVGELTGHQAWITALSFSPDGQTLASAGADRTWRLWDVPVRTLRRIFPGLPCDVLRLRFSADGQKVFTGSRDGTIYRWSVTTPPAQRQPSVWPNTQRLTDLAVAPDGSRIAALQRGEVYVGDLQAETLPSPLSELGTNNSCLLFSSDGKLLFAGTQTGEVQVWSLVKCQRLRVLHGAGEPVKLLRQDPEGRVLVTVQSTADFEVERPYPPSRIEVWNAAEWRRQNSWIVQGVARKLVSTDGRWLAMNLSPRVIRVWSLRAPPQTNDLSFQGEILAIAFSPDGRLLAAANDAGTVRTWKVPSFREWKEFNGHAYPLAALAFSPDTRRLATAGDGDQAVKLWDVRSWQELIRLPHEKATVRELIFSTDGSQIVATTSSGELLCWRPPALFEIARKPEPPSAD